MTSDTDRLRADIEDTRADLGHDVDALTEKVDPRRMADRSLQSIRDTAVDVKEQVMGTGSDLAEGVSVTAAEAVRAPIRGTRGNPLAAGLIAFGVGWLLGSVLPMSETEREAAGRALEAAEPVRDEVMEVADQLKEGMREPVQEAAQQIKESATAASGAVKETATNAMNDY